MLRSILAWQEELKTNPNKPVPDYLCDCFIKLVENLSHKCAYHTEVEDMKAQALLNCIKYGRNFDITKSCNAFAYYSRIVLNAMASVHNSSKEFIDFKFNLVKELENSDGYNYRTEDHEDDY